MTADDVYDRLVAAERLASRQIWLIASENLAAPAARLALATSAANRYLFRYPHAGADISLGTDFQQRCHDECVAELKSLFAADWVSLKPLSGMTALAMTVLACTKPGDEALFLPTAFGGHTHTERIVSTLGRRYGLIPVSANEEWHDIDCEQLARRCELSSPALVYLDPMSWPYQLDWEAIRQAVPPHCLLHCDVSHLAGLIAGGVVRCPLDAGFSSICGSTHKTFPAGQKAFFATRDRALYGAFHDGAGQLVSSWHTGEIVALRLALEEMRGHWQAYAQGIVANARALSGALEARGFGLAGRRGHATDGHLFFLNLGEQTRAIELAQALAATDLIVHPLAIPSGHQSWGLRIGVQEVSHLGMGPAEMLQIADILQAIALQGIDPARCRDAVHELRRCFPHPPHARAGAQRLRDLIDAVIGCHDGDGRENGPL